VYPYVARRSWRRATRSSRGRPSPRAAEGLRDRVPGRAPRLAGVSQRRGAFRPGWPGRRARAAASAATPGGEHGRSVEPDAGFTATAPAARSARRGPHRRRRNQHVGRAGAGTRELSASLHELGTRGSGSPPTQSGLPTCISPNPSGNSTSSIRTAISLPRLSAREASSSTHSLWTDRVDQSTTTQRALVSSAASVWRETVPEPQLFVPEHVPTARGQGALDPSGPLLILALVAQENVGHGLTSRASRRPARQGRARDHQRPARAPGPGRLDPDSAP
jgi:hypothetical protein